MLPVLLLGEKLEEVIDVFIDEDLSVKELIDIYEKTHGFTSAYLVQGCKILAEMVSKGGVTKFLAFTGNIVSTGVRGLIAQMINDGLFDVVITTCGAIDHDIAKSLSKYYRGVFEANDIELRRKGIHRLGNIFIPIENYGKVIEDFVKERLVSVLKSRSEWSVYELLWEVGALINDEKSILRAAYKHKIPIFVPGIVDGAFGTQLFIQSQFLNFKINLFKDMSKLSDIVFASRETGALIIGGGISKHHAIWWNQFKGGLDYAVYITTAVEWDGSLSGAHVREAISWGKVKEGAKRCVIYGEATLILPLLYVGLKKYLKEVSRSN
ncbi:MAG TPA: deoxyhypusine synthase [Acidilobales archaeon]|nr:deoxyhypusine synthase [Acidilobales archaeon]